MLGTTRHSTSGARAKTTIQLIPWLKAELVVLAQGANRPLSNYIEAVLERHVREVQGGDNAPGEVAHAARHDPELLDRHFDDMVEDILGDSR